VFFFQAEDGIRDFHVTGVQTCALPIYGTMDWMARHGDKRARPPELVPGTLRVVSVGLDYGQDPDQARNTLADGQRAYVARYALRSEERRVGKGGRGRVSAETGEERTT